MLEEVFVSMGRHGGGRFRDRPAAKRRGRGEPCAGEYKEVATAQRDLEKTETLLDRRTWRPSIAGQARTALARQRHG